MNDDLAHRLDALAAARRVLVSLDVDGTLAPLVDEPMSARVTPEAARAVAALAAAPDTTVAFVSGRTLADLRVITEHGDDSPVWLAGSHGAEHWRPEGAPPRMRPVAEDDARIARQADAIRADAARLAKPFGGAWIEEKAFGFALHTRTAASGDEAAAQEAVDALMVERAPRWRRRTGKRVVEFAYRHEGKDTAIAELREATGADAVLFAGDDVTDEDALRSLEEHDLGIRVGEGQTAASARVDDIAGLVEALERLAELRRG